MNQENQIDAFARDLSALVSRYASEFQLSTAAAVGVLEIEKQRIITQAFHFEDEDE